MAQNFLKRNIASVMGYVMVWIGYTMFAGSIIAFASMNSGEMSKDSTFFFWQRHFVDSAIAIATMPGVWLLFVGSLFLYLGKRTRRELYLSLVSMLIVIVSQGFIIPIAKRASAIAYRQAHLQSVSDIFLSEKAMEDKLGAVNGMLLLIYLAVLFFYHTKQYHKDSV